MIVALLRWPRHSFALLQIGFLLTRADLLFPLERIPGFPGLLRVVRILCPPAAAVRSLRPGQRLAWALQRLGPSFIKLGQALSIRSDLIGEAAADDLAELQDRLPPFPGARARAVIEAELGQPLETLFARFDEDAIAAASVAQVHFAETHDGRQVAVKVLRPGVEAAFARDLDLFLWLAQGLEALLPQARRLRPVDVVGQLAQSVMLEMDLRYEAAAASELAENFKGDPGFRVPAVDWALTARRVITTARVEGIPIGDKAALLAAGHDLTAIVTNAATFFFNMVLRDGFFHADLHPGNLFVAADGAIVAVDFGIMGRIDRRHRIYLADLLTGFLTGDYKRVAEVHFEAGFVPATESVDAFTLACRSIGQPLLGRPLAEISVGRLLSQLFQITHQFNMETQPQLLMLQKTMVLAEGVGRNLDPTINMWVLTQPLIEEWMIANRSPPARVLETARALLQGLERLPQLIAATEKLVLNATANGISLHADTVKAVAGSGGGGRVALPLWVIAVLLALAILHGWR
jgi:ubiquinone biosynthesis protein